MKRAANSPPQYRFLVLVILTLNFGFYQSAYSQQTLTTFAVSDLAGIDVNCVGLGNPKVVNSGNESEWLLVWVETPACGGSKYKIKGRILDPDGQLAPLKFFSKGYLEAVSFDSIDNAYLFLYWNKNLKARSFDKQLQKNGKSHVVDNFKSGFYFPSADFVYDPASGSYVSLWLERLLENTSDYTELNGRLLSGVGKPTSKTSTFLQAESGKAFSYADIEREPKTGNYLIMVTDTFSPGFLKALAIGPDGSTILRGPVTLGKNVGLAALAFDGTGNGCVVWQSSKSGIRSRKISSEGKPLSGTAKVKKGRVLYPDVVFDAAHNEYVATWVQDDKKIEGARLNPNNCKVVGSIFPVASKSPDFEGTIQWLDASYDVASGKIAVVWVEYSEGFDLSQEQVRGAIFQK